MTYRIKETVKTYNGRTETLYKIQYKFLLFWIDYKFTKYYNSDYYGFHADGLLSTSFTNLDHCKLIKEQIETNNNKDIDIGIDRSNRNNIIYVDLGSKYNTGKKFNAYLNKSSKLDTLKLQINERREKEYNNKLVKTQTNYIY